MRHTNWRQWVLGLICSDSDKGRKDRRLAQVRQREGEGDQVLRCVYELALHQARSKEPSAEQPSPKDVFRALDQLIPRREVPRMTADGRPRERLARDDAELERIENDSPCPEDRLAARQVLAELFRTEPEELVEAWIAWRLAQETIRDLAAALQIEESYLGKQLRALERRVQKRAERWRRPSRLAALVALVALVGGAIGLWWRRWRRQLVWTGAGIAMVGVGWGGWSLLRQENPPARSTPVASMLTPAEVGPLDRVPPRLVVPPPHERLGLLGQGAPDEMSSAQRGDPIVELPALRAGRETQPRGDEGPPEDVLDACGSPPGRTGSAALRRGELALLLLARDPATATELDVLGHLLETRGSAFQYDDVPPPTRTELGRLDAMLREPDPQDCPALRSAAVYVLSLRQVFQGHGEPCWGRPHAGCAVGPAQPLQSDHLVTVVCRALLHNEVSYDGVAEPDSPCRPAFHSPHAELQGGPWGTNDWFAPPATVLAELVEASVQGARADALAPLDGYLGWLRAHPPGAMLTLADASALLSLLPRAAAGN